MEHLELTGNVYDYYELDALVWDKIIKNGDILVQPKLDFNGRVAIEGRHNNLGYSGYFNGYLVVDNKARKLLNWKDLWANKENFYLSQKVKSEALRCVEDKIFRLRGSTLIKVKGGWLIEN